MRRNPTEVNMAQAGAAPGPPAPPGGQMMLMLFFMLLMMLLLMNEGFRSGLADYADPLLAPILPEEKWFVITVFFIGTVSMLINTVLRNFFIDPIKQAHIGHRMSQVRRMMNEATLARDPIRKDKAATLQQQLMPEQMDVQMGGMKPMMFTFIFIIAIFAWVGEVVSGFRVDYVSLPWKQHWNMSTGTFLFFPAWICVYICMSAPLGRAVDRHIKLLRFKSHPVVLAGEKIPEPYLHLIQTKEGASSGKGRGRNNQRKTRSKAKSKKQVGKLIPTAISARTPPQQGTICPECDGDVVERAGSGELRCSICRHQWK